MQRLMVRLLSGVVGLFAGIVALYIPLSFIANEVQEAQSARQYNGHPSCWGLIGGSLVILLITGLFGVTAYRFVRRAVAPQKSS